MPGDLNEIAHKTLQIAIGETYGRVDELRS